MLDPADPHLVVHSRMVYLCWLPAAPDAVVALLPAGLRAGADPHVFMNQYVVDDETQTSGLGAYSLTYLGICVAGQGAPGGWWTHYLCSSPRMRGYAAARGAPVGAGRTWLERRGDTLVAQTEVDGVPLIRTRVHVGHTGHLIRSGHHRYVTARDGELTGGVHPYVAEPVTPFEVESVDFLDPDHPVHALRPANPLTITEGFYSPRASFAYPGGTGGYAPAHQVPERRARSGLPSGS
ncbi:acetoacetate decarboxylase family protein [Micromonospora haikouensis]|uniref:acetoacetate decarboxylase family protein n=1 Tax=Micromonospora haikouensis TaxID=686309 RepID=UPI00367E161C